ncbi:MAG TPA: SDR family NAD(P)-dependent oxidoreductase [Nevskiaceae bacterium]
MDTGLQGARVIVTGGSRGIGRAAALAFARVGADVSVCARHAADLDALRQELEALHVRVHVAPCDVGDYAALRAYAKAAAAALGGVDVLVNNASGFGGGDTEEGWQAGICVDLLGTVRMTRLALPWLERSPRASVVHVTSIAGVTGSARSVSYAAVKAALINHARSEARSLAAKGIRINTVAPGAIEFPGGRWEHRQRAEPELYDKTLAAIPFARLGRPEEVADVIVFLASSAASWITGQTIVVDGGQLQR